MQAVDHVRGTTSQWAHDAVGNRLPETVDGRHRQAADPGRLNKGLKESLQRARAYLQSVKDRIGLAPPARPWRGRPGPARTAFPHS